MAKNNLFYLSIALLLSSNIMAQNNLLDTSTWTVGTGGAPNFTPYGPDSENARVIATNPHGVDDIMWVSLADGSPSNSQDGGFASSYIPIDNTKTYRFTVWQRKTDASNGGTYMGAYGQNSASSNGLYNPDGNKSNNHYFFWGTHTQLFEAWYLVVGYIHPPGYTGPNLGGIYRKDTGQKVNDINVNDLTFDSSTTHVAHRSLLFGNNGTLGKLYHWKPTIYEVNGSEPTLQELLNPSTTTNVTGIFLSPTTVTMSIGANESLVPSITPTNATDNSISWSSSDTTVATVNTSGQINAVAQGSATITVTTNDGGFTAQTTVTVTTGTPTSSTSVWSEANSTASYTGEVAIGRSSVPNGYKLAVDGNIRTREVRVDQENWPDYVFEKDYELASLDEIKRHIQNKGHLPNVPSAKEVASNGFELGEMNRLLLEKIEELTLYLIQQKEQNEALRTRIAALERKNLNSDQP